MLPVRVVNLEGGSYTGVRRLRGEHLHVLVGDTRSQWMIERLKEQGWGRMVIDRHLRLFPGEKWGFDNGAFRDYKNNVVEFNGDGFQRRLDVAFGMGTPMLAVVPDIVGGGLGSLEFSERWLSRLPDAWPWYLAVQDGMEVADVEPILGRYKGIFLGGTDAFKATAKDWVALSRRLHLPFHYGRAGIPRKVAHAKAVGADSLDSAFPLWSKSRFTWFVEVVNNGHPQMMLPGTAW